MKHQPGSGASPSHRVLEEAAHWFAALRCGEPDETQRDAWREWLARSEEHGRAWLYVERIGQRFGAVQASGAPGAALGALEAVRHRRLGRRQVLGSLAGLGVSGLLGYLAWRQGALPEFAMAWMADYRTATGEIREVRLADGSRLWLNTASAVNADFDTRRRRIVLVSGEILLQTAADARRPFLVDTAHGRLRALGTRFSVRVGDAGTLLAVYGGAVEIAAAGGARQVVPAGRQARFTGEAIAALQPADRARQAWTDGVLLARNITLGELLGELARYHRGHLGVAPEVAHLRVLGSYPLRDPDRALAMLEAVLPVTVHRPLPWWVSIEPADPTAAAR